MKSITIHLLEVLIILLSVSTLPAQPTAFTRAVSSLEFTEPVVPEPVDLNEVLTEDIEREESSGPYSFAVSRQVSITPQTGGLWEEIDNETLLWRLPIASPDAVSLSLGFSRYFMPPGGRMYIYSADESRVIGPFTKDDNKETGQLWTPIIPSDAIIVEVSIPAAQVPELELELTTINHGYRDLNLISYYGVGDSQWCQRNAACSEGKPWRDQIRSVALYQTTYKGRSYLCTGSLVNNTAEDDKPYFLTSFGCFDANQNRIPDDRRRAAESMVIYWNFQSPTCDSYTVSLNHSQSGATYVAGYWKSDFVLVELDQKPSPAFNVYYAGWDRSDSAPSSGAAIHHPNGDIKKISVENNPLSTVALTKTNSDFNYGTYFMVDAWDVGIMAESSSGAPLFNSDRRIVGQFKSGNSACGTPGPDYFGPFYRSWSEGRTRNKSLGCRLDPLGTDVMFLDGKNLTDTVCQNMLIGNGTVNWDFPMYTWYHDSRTQVIYLSSEIKGSGTITGLALYVTKLPGQKLNNWTIRMKHTDISSYSDNWMYSSGWTEVFNNDVTITDTGWQWFDFQLPFVFNGKNNLMVDFSHNNNSYSGAGSCRSTQKATTRTLYAYSDSRDGDPLLWNGLYAPNISSTDRAPNLLLKFYED